MGADAADIEGACVEGVLSACAVDAAESVVGCAVVAAACGVEGRPEEVAVERREGASDVVEAAPDEATTGLDGPAATAEDEEAVSTAEGPAAGAAAFRIGVDVLVDRYMMSLPCTTRLSLDFLRSLVSVSAMMRRCQSEGSDGLVSLCIPSPPSSRSMTCDTRTLMTPRKP